jgi:hypothetical protein
LVIPLGHHRGAGLLLGATHFLASGFLPPESYITQFVVLTEFFVTRLSVLTEFSVAWLFVLAEFSATWLSVLTTRLEHPVFCSMLPTWLTRLEFPDFRLLSRLPRLS